jgi:catalase
MATLMEADAGCRREPLGTRPETFETSGECAMGERRRARGQSEANGGPRGDGTGGAGRRPVDRVLTTNHGVPLADTDNSLRLDGRGPTLLEDFHLREKITHFDHERIPERVVHARGTGAHGTFQLYESCEDVTCARFLCETGVETPVFVRFSTVIGSRGSADTVRDVRGFAVKFYTDEGNFDLVGNNIPVFFIQDGIKFPDIIHAAKPEPDWEIPQAQTAHDTFWDFCGLTPESTHMLMWAMSDRAIPRSFRMMEGFGVHTFRLVNAAGDTTLCKFHWKPALGVHGLVWEEAQELAGADPDFHRRDLWQAIAAGAFPQWELGLQLLPDSEDQMFEGIDLLDATKLVPEEIAPVRTVGVLTLNRNPSNFFAEVEQAAFHTGNLVRGIDVTDDPLLHARLFSYLDTQLIRLGGPNFHQIPVNRPHVPVDNNQRDGYHQHEIHTGRTSYAPNSLSGGCPMAVGEAGYVHVPLATAGRKVRERPASFADHFSQAAMFWHSMTPPEQDHIVLAFRFELGKCDTPEVVDRMLGNLANVDGELVARVAAGLGRPVPKGGAAEPPRFVSSALSMVYAEPGAVDGRTVAVVATDSADLQALRTVIDALTGAGAVGFVTASHAGDLGGRNGSGVRIERTFLTNRSVEFDAVVLADGTAPLAEDPGVIVFVQEAFRHMKTLAAWGDGAEVLAAAGIGADAAMGVITAARPTPAFLREFVAALGMHRHWDRAPVAVAG